jgi:hypothetical protein
MRHIERSVLLASLFVLASGLPARGEEKGQQAAAPKAMAEVFLATVQQGEIDAAIDTLIANSPMLQLKPQEIAVLKNQTRSMLPLYGSMLGYEKVKEEMVGTSIVSLVFLARYDKHPIAWRLIFYRPKDQWYVSAFKWSDAFEGLF